jgi:5,10-methylene-tetrahydrofolate dehydrogenase/methenyl tetrahydrofolate cyclohydrolase
MSTKLDTPSYIVTIMKELQGGLNGVEVVIFQRTDLVGGITAHYVPPCAAQRGCVQQWTKDLQRATVNFAETEGGQKR